MSLGGRKSEPKSSSEQNSNKIWSNFGGEQMHAAQRRMVAHSYTLSVGTNELQRHENLPEVVE